MGNTSDFYELNDIKKRLNDLYITRTNQEEYVKNIRESEMYEQMGYDDSEYDYEPPMSNVMMAENELSEIHFEVIKMEDVLQKIEQCEEVKKKYTDGYKRTIRQQDYKEVVDKLNRKEKAKEIANIVAQKQVKTVGIFGEWGTGKSTFLEYLKDDLPKENVKVIDIKATEYSDQEKIWAYFFTKMKDSVKKDYYLYFKYYWLRIKKNKKKLFVPLLYIGLIISLSVLLFRCDFLNHYSVMMGMSEEIAQKVNDGVNWFVLILFTIKWILPLIKQIMDSIVVTMNNFTSLQKREVAEKLGYKAVVKEYIEEIINIWGNYRFIFCIDELDRCNNRAIMSFLEAVQLLEDYKAVQIIYTIDKEIILKAIKESGIHNPHNYLKKYVDIKVDLVSINTQSNYIEDIAKDYYEFSEKEIEKIKFALEKLEINISVRDYIHVLNSLSELKEWWINEEVIPEKSKRKEESEESLHWYNSIPIAIFFFAGSVWPTKIYNDFRTFERAHIKVYHIAENGGIEEQYRDCPDFLKQTKLRDVMNVMRFLRNMPPVYNGNVDKI